MAMQELLDAIKGQLGEVFSGNIQADAGCITFSVQPNGVLPANQCLFEKQNGRFVAITGVDTPEGLELLYHYALDGSGWVVSIQTVVDIACPEVESIALLIPGAEWAEREVHDLLGIRFKNHPNPKRLVLADDWPEGVYPLRSDFKP